MRIFASAVGQVWEGPDLVASGTCIIAGLRAPRQHPKAWWTANVKTCSWKPQGGILQFTGEKNKTCRHLQDWVVVPSSSSYSIIMANLSLKYAVDESKPIQFYCLSHLSQTPRLSPADSWSPSELPSQKPWKHLLLEWLHQCHGNRQQKVTARVRHRTTWDAPLRVNWFLQVQTIT